jgi:uncharacterized protein (DUF433 family)
VNWISGAKAQFRDRHFKCGVLTITGKPSSYTFLVERIEINPDICNGRPIIKGTRITVQTVLEFLGAGDSVEDVLEAYPSLQRVDVLAALQFSSRLMANHFTVQSVA